MFSNISLKNRIALLYSCTFSVVLLVIFMLIYYTINYGVNRNMYEILNEEVTSHVDYVLHEPTLKNYVHPDEWKEVEHTDISLNPVFIAIYNQNFQLVDNSPNLVQNQLNWNPNEKENTPYLADYNTITLVQSQAKLIHHGEVVGYVVVGLSTKHNQLALSYLKTVLLVVFPISVLLIFMFARFIAATSTKPIFTIINTADRISNNNLSERIVLPTHKDELYVLSQTINSLLDRLEHQIVKATQFSADASHELRTPLAIVKGTLEILNRKNRTVEEYNEKISYTLTQVARLERLVEQFLVLSRLENNSSKLTKTTFDAKVEVLKSIERFHVFLQEKHIHVSVENLSPQSVENIIEFFEIIVDNILSNAIKYCSMNGQISVASYVEDEHYILSFIDNGIGINQSDVENIQKRFYRGENVDYDKIKGYGIGLNIVAQLAALSDIEVSIQSTKQEGTEIQIRIQTGKDKLQ